MTNRPLGLYVHMPWCVEKCPYCDFNSHKLKHDIPESDYVAHLLHDLSEDVELIANRQIRTVFIGGGTPSIFSANAIHKLLRGIRHRVNLSATAEITLEANPGTVEVDRFLQYAEIGVNRISIGVQTFQDQQLALLGRIHDGQQAIDAIKVAHSAGLETFNVDIMHGLPQQTPEAAMADLQLAIDLGVPHISWYQLTIEPNTQFASKPPQLPSEDVLSEIQDAGEALLAKHGYRQYEVSAFSQIGHQCQHNLNYWRFGDYLGIGCGAHGKISTDINIQRRVKVKHPAGYMDLAKDYLDTSWVVASQDLPFEYFMNRLRLLEPFSVHEYEQLTGERIPTTITQVFNRAIARELLTEKDEHWQLTPLGLRYLNSLLTEFI